MSLIDFPDPRTFEYAEWIRVGNYLYPADGIVYFGGELTVANLQNAYQKGIFPCTRQRSLCPGIVPTRERYSNSLIFTSREALRKKGVQGTFRIRSTKILTP